MQQPTREEIERAAVKKSGGRATKVTIAGDSRVWAWYRQAYAAAPDWHDMGKARDLLREFPEDRT